MYQCVPSWDLDDPVGGAGLNPVSAGAHRLVSGAGDFTPVIVPMSDQYYEVAELTWEKGNISSRGLLNRPVPKYPPASSHLQAIGSSGGGDRETLEAVVGEAAARSAHLAHPVPAPWLGVASAPVDALVPCARDEAEGEARRNKRARVLGEDGRVCASQGSAAPGRGDGESTLLTLEACGTGADDVCGFTTTTNYSTSLEREDKGSPETENTSIGGGASDSRCFSRRSQRDGLCDEGNNVVIKGEAAVRSPSTSTKRSRAAAIHNESERKRRDRINQKMKTLQKLVPNSSKTDKASMLDEAVDYLKQLQAQVQVMSRMSSMMMPMAMPQLQMSVMANMAQMAQMGLGMMNMLCPGQPGYAGLTPAMNMMHPPPFVPVSWDAAAAARPQQPAGSAVPDALSAFLACQVAQQNAQQQQQQPNSMEAYNRMVALYQKLNHQQQQQQFSQPSNSKQ